MTTVRKIYIDLMAKKLKRAEFGWLARLAVRFGLTVASHHLNRPLCGPILATLSTNYGCNLNCRMCDIQNRGRALKHKGKRELDTSGMLALIDELADLGVLGIGITGGEPLLRPDLFELIARIQKRGLITHLNSNGCLIDEASARRIINAKVDSLNISLDGATPETHDRIRGVEGAFERAKAALGLMRRLRDEAGSNLRLKAVFVAQEENAGELHRFLLGAMEWGADAVEVIPLQRFTREDGGLRNSGGEDLARAAMSELRKASASGVKIENSQGMIDLFPATFSGRPSPLKCLAGYNSLVVDSFGEVYVCVPKMNWGEAVGNLGDQRLKNFWRSEGYAAARKEASKCKRCTLNCQAELNLPFQPFL